LQVLPDQLYSLQVRPGAAGAGQVAAAQVGALQKLVGRAPEESPVKRPGG